MSIREIVEGHYSQFISLVDLINATAATSGLDFDVVSNAFWRTRILDTVTHWKLCGKTGDLIESDGELNRSELAQFVGSVRNFVFEAVLGILALPRQGKNPQGSSRHRRNEAIRVQNGELIHRAFPMRHRPLPLRCDVA